MKPERLLLANYRYDHTNYRDDQNKLLDAHWASERLH